MNNFFNNWIANDGPAKVFDALVYSPLYLPDDQIASSIPVYIWGKKYRSSLASSQHPQTAPFVNRAKQDFRSWILIWNGTYKVELTYL